MSQVTVAQGVVLGEQRTTFDGTKYHSFEGIPYAKPPVGNLRFTDPQPPDDWCGVRDCTKPGNKCAQINPSSKKGFEGSEDCLYLNVYTPQLPAEKIRKLPVLFFVHGGRLTFGYGDYYQPDYFIRHDVILVTFNYRLNILGFLSLDIPDVPGNAGMKDCVAALRWVKNNIQAFNGDENNITLYGESAGGAICTSFLTSKMTEGLYNKMITLSGNHIGDVFMCVQDHVEVARRVARTFNKEIKDVQELLEFFRSLPVDELVSGFMRTKNYRTLHPLLMTVVEKEFPGVQCFSKEPPLLTIVEKRFQTVPMIVGYNMYEGGAFVYKDKKGRIHYEQDLRTFIPAYLYLTKDDPKSMKIANKLREYYFKGKDIGDETKTEYVQMLTDAYFNRDITNFTELIAKNNTECYFYKFNYVGNLNIGIMKNLGVHGATHGDSVQYHFYRPSHGQRASESDRKMVDFFSETFSNFAKNSKPSWSNQKFQWVPYTNQEKKTLIVDEGLSLVRNPDWEMFKFWSDVCGDRAKL